MSGLARCRCGRMSVGDARNWNPDCPEHGVDSEWYRSPEQVEHREKQSTRLRSLQAQARGALTAGPRSFVQPSGVSE